MKKLIVSLVATLVVVLGFSNVASADHGAPEKRVGVTGTTNWPEMLDVIRRLHDDYHLPVYNGCHQGQQLCIHVSHYYAADGAAAWTYQQPGWPGAATLRFNNYYDRGYGHRMQVLIHEFGHALGLWEHSHGCDSSMQHAVAACGYYIIGYSAEEQYRLWDIWR